MTFDQKADGLWHGQFMYKGQLLTAAAADLTACIFKLGSALNALTNGRII